MEFVVGEVVFDWSTGFSVDEVGVCGEGIGFEGGGGGVFFGEGGGGGGLLFEGGGGGAGLWDSWRLW